MVSVNL